MGVVNYIRLKLKLWFRYGHGVVWTGDKFIVAGGWGLYENGLETESCILASDEAGDTIQCTSQEPNLADYRSGLSMFLVEDNFCV